MNSEQIQRWDIFCNIVDNFGDIGVCWRLSRQLAEEHQLVIRLFIDDFAIASKIIPNFDTTKQTQTIHGVVLQAWPTSEITLPNVVIENFSCKLPDRYSKQVAQHNQTHGEANPIIWINLEYLSAEQWVEDCHTLPSPHPTLAYTRYFFYPGFTAQTGGLLREAALLTRRDAFIASQAAQQAFWQQHIHTPLSANFEESIKISLFSYPQADIESLIKNLAQSEQKISLILPYNTEIKALSQIIDTYKLSLETALNIENISLYLINFLKQKDYDKLLWACDLNFVRGEDSWIRAIWAGKPFIWQPYIQTEDSHITKLNAFLANYAAKDPLSHLIKQANLTWSNATQEIAIDWLTTLTALPEWSAYSLKYSNHLAKQADLCTRLVTFSNKLKYVD
jgi:uncharacterized repeat protein (TIGR03837 family)